MRSSSHTHKRARQLRRVLTPPEAMLWVRLRMLRDQGLTFRRQHPIGPYIADFYCSAAKLVVEVDGAVHSEDMQIDHDARRNEYLARLGYRVIRCTAADVFRDANEVVVGIVQAALAV
ncbi:MAG: endonuclease domain-containing protein [Caulobacterales bacterium]